ncbi:MAG TPA: TonB-dependent receptor [Asticcacaulis sp.]|nr:TonB-dependent receptor [Asticcacaulis sp.]
MRSSNGKLSVGANLLKGGVSVLALSAMAATLAAPAYAQDDTTKASDNNKSTEVVVVGVRKALKTAQDLKKNADTIVDSITANDIGSFPDKSVAEALQRVAGITVNRFAATGDTAHFSAEPSGVVVRGLQQVRSEFNGRDIFTADSSRGLSWSDVSPELMGGVDTYKNQTAELIEGGIAGTINLRTRLPFDQKGQLMALTAEYVYGDKAKQGEPGVSGIYSNRWDTQWGEFGFMINAAHSKEVTNSEGIQYGRLVPVENSAYWNINRIYVPMTTSLRDNIYFRTRDGVSLAGQWQNHDHSMLLTFQYNQSKKVEQWEEYVATSSTGIDAWAQQINYVSSGGNLECYGGASACSFNSDGVLTSGTFVNSNGAWYGSWDAPDGVTSPSGVSPTTPNGLMRTCYSWEASATCPATQRAGTFEASTRWSDSKNDTRDASLNFKWDVNDKLHTNFDVQYVDAIQKNYDISDGLQTYAQANIKYDGDHPTMTFADDNGGWYDAATGSTAAANGLNFGQSAVGWYLAPGGISNPANYRMHWIMDHLTDSQGHEFATRADLAYSFDSPWLNTLKAGVRYADREQTVRWSTYNWANVVNNWSNYNADNYYITGSAFPDQNAYGTHTFDQNFFGGGVTNISDVVFFKTAYLKDRQTLDQTFDMTHYQPQYTGGGSSNAWTPICYRSGETDGCFRPAEVADVSEKTKAAYVQLKFGGPDASIGGINVVGNIGVRYVETVNESTGGVNYQNSTVYDYTPIVAGSAPGQPSHPSITYYVPGLTGTPPAVTAAPGTQAYTDQVAAAQAYVNDPANWTEDRLFSGTPNNSLQTAHFVHHNWLPSFNVRLGLTDTWFLRFAASRAMSRPDIGNLKMYTSVGMSLPSAASSSYQCGVSNSAFNCDANGNIVSTKVVYTANANNPGLRPITADQFDLAAENYFSSTGSFTFTLFYKKFHDYIQYGRYTAQFTNAGVTRDVIVSGPVNGDGASIKGFEVAYQTFFDKLPAPFNGLGIQTNYTHLVNSGIHSSNVVVNSGDGSSGQLGGGASGTTVAANAAVSYTNLPLEGLSDDSYNLIGMYEKGNWSARLAYNWRSKYLVTSQDCCVVFPMWQKAAGYLDGRLAYRINEHVEISVEGSNLLNTQTVLMQQVDGPMSNGANDPTKLIPASWFQQDRRFQATISLKY